MKLYHTIFITFLLLLLNALNAQNTLDTALVSELERMSQLDQLVATNSEAPKGFTLLSKSELKDSIYRAHSLYLETVLEDKGYPGYNMVGKRASTLFFTMIQHADHDIELQKRVLEALNIEVKRKNASPRHLALLTDRIKINSNEKQIYGTQVTYKFLSGKAECLPVEDQKNLNKRRAEMGLEPIEVYLEEMTQINKRH